MGGRFSARKVAVEALIGQPLLEQAQQAVLERWRRYEHMAKMDLDLGVVPGAREEGRDE
jgi:hypothetical protein